MSFWNRLNEISQQLAETTDKYAQQLLNEGPPDGAAQSQQNAAQGKSALSEGFTETPTYHPDYAQSAISPSVSQFQRPAAQQQPPQAQFYSHVTQSQAPVVQQQRSEPVTSQRPQEAEKYESLLSYGQASPAEPPHAPFYQQDEPHQYTRAVEQQTFQGTVTEVQQSDQQRQSPISLQQTVHTQPKSPPALQFAPSTKTQAAQAWQLPVVDQQQQEPPVIQNAPPIPPSQQPPFAASQGQLPQTTDMPVSPQKQREQPAVSTSPQRQRPSAVKVPSPLKESDIVPSSPATDVLQSQIQELEEEVQDKQVELEELTKALVLTQEKNRQLLDQLEAMHAASPKSAAQSNTNHEDQQMIAALKLQIDDLHKQTQQLRVKDQELAKERSHGRDLQEQLETVIDARKQQDELLETTRREVKVAQAEAEKNKSAVVTAGKALQALKMSQQSVSDLQQELEQLKLSQLSSESTATKQLQETASRQEKQLQDLQQQLEQAQDHHESARAELSLLSTKSHEHELVVERVREENASTIAKLMADHEQDSLAFKEKQLELTELQATVTKLELQHASAKGALTRTQSDGVAALQRLKAEHEGERHTVMAQLTQMNAELQTARQTIAQLQSAQQSQPVVDQNTAQQQMEQMRQQYEDRIKAVEQDNLRLRDRVQRAERQLEPQTSPARTSSQANLVSGITALPWLESKNDDFNYYDLESPGNVISGGGGTRMAHRPQGGGLDRVKYFARYYTRQSLRQLDLYSIRFGFMLKEQPVTRLVAIAYIIMAHLLLVYMIIW